MYAFRGEALFKDICASLIYAAAPCPLDWAPRHLSQTFVLRIPEP